MPDSEAIHLMPPASEAQPTDQLHPSPAARGAVIGVCIIAAAFAIGSARESLAASAGHYTEGQATHGQEVYAQHCASCHGSNLQGKSGPALKGEAFAQNLQYSKMSAQQLFDFIKTHMPADEPGSLTDEQYLQVFAHMLSENGYSAGSSPLSKDSVAKVELLPLPKAGGDQSGAPG
jgi:mono/diheme cytochrome c family protein